MTSIDALVLTVVIVLVLSSPMTGSFLKCWADRSRVGQSVAQGRSYCDECGKTLSARDLIPVLSWSMSGGKARCCGAPLRWTLLTPEITSTLLAFWALFAASPNRLLPALVIAWLLQAIALLAVPAPRIATIIAMILALIGLALSLAGLSGDIETHLLGFALGLLIAAVAWTGASDPRARYLRAAAVMPPMGALLGVPLIAYALTIGIGLSLVHMLYARWLRDDDLSPATSLAIGAAGGTWIVWLYADYFARMMSHY